MAADTMTFRRRNVFERKALRLVRGETCATEYDGLTGGGTQSASPGQYNRAHFGCLREFAGRNGFVILPPDAQYVMSSELVILRWLAEAQRRTGLRTCHFRDIGLKTSLRHCAGALKGLGVALPAKTLHIHTVLDDELPTPNNALYRAMGHENGYGKAHSVEHVVTCGGSGQT